MAQSRVGALLQRLVAQIKRLVPDKQCLKEGGEQPFADRDAMARMRNYRTSADGLANGRVRP
jgi:hypothetical protein